MHKLQPRWSPVPAPHEFSVCGRRSSACSKAVVRLRPRRLATAVAAAAPPTSAVSSQGSAAPPGLPPVANWHLEARCNYSCHFCFATFKDVLQRGDEVHDREMLLQVPRMLRDAGATRVSFVGGEPFLHPMIEELIAAAKGEGLATSAVTNGSLLDEARLLRLAGKLDWLAFSVDSSSDAVHTAIGRGLPREVVPRPHECGGSSSASSRPSTHAAPAARAPVAANRHLQRVRSLWAAAREVGMRMKLNTVVTAAALEDDMAGLVAELRPERWKVFQVLPVSGQNSGSVEKLLVTAEQFRSYVERHRGALRSLERQHGVAPGALASLLVAEDNEAMTASYAMLDASGRFFDNSAGEHTYGPSIFEVGVEEAWRTLHHGAGFSAQRFLGRGGLYDWGQSEQQAVLQDMWRAALP